MKWLRPVSGLLGLLAFAGCTVSPDIGVLDLRSGTMTHPTMRGWRQIVVSVDGAHGSFATIGRQESALVLSSYDKGCNLLLERKLPLFRQAYCSAWEYAVSDDLKTVAYMADPSFDLTLLDQATGRKTIVQQGFTSSSQETAWLKWIDRRTLLAVRRKFPGSTRTRNEISLVDVGSRQIRPVYQPVYPNSFGYALTPDRRLLAFVDGAAEHSIDGFIKVIHVRTGRTVARLGSGGDMVSCPWWSSDGAELAFLEGKFIKVWNRASNVTRVVTTIPEGKICYHVVLGDGLLGYVAAGANASSKPMVIVDLKTGVQVRKVKAQFNGSIVPFDKHTVICELGY